MCYSSGSDQEFEVLFALCRLEEINGVDDLYTPEITNAPGFDATVSVVCTVENDQKKVQAILNQIKGLNHDDSPGPGIPKVFGMKFQAVSVGQKLEKDNSDGSRTEDTQFTGQSGGYLDGSGTPTAVLAYGLQQTDAALASMIKALKDQVSSTPASSMPGLQLLSGLNLRVVKRNHSEVL